MFSIHFTSSNEKTKYKKLDSVIPTEVVKRYVWFNDEDEDQVFMINENNDFLFKKSCYKGDEFLQTQAPALPGLFIAKKEGRPQAAFFFAFYRGRAFMPGSPLMGGSRL